MSRRFRLLAAGLSVALTGGVLAAAPSPASAEAAPVAVYECGLLGDVPVNLDVADSVTVPAGQTLGQITGSLGLSDLLSSVGKGLTNLLVTVDGLTVTLDGTATNVTASSAGALTIPPLSVPAVSGTFPVTLPQTIDVEVLGGLLHSLLASVRCTIKGTDNVVTTLLVQGSTTPGTDGTPGPGAGPVPAGGSSPTVNASRSNPCVATPAARAGQRATKMRASTVKRSWKKRPAIKLTVKAKRKAARGKVIACYGAMKIGQKKLRKGKATLRTLRFYPGRYHVKLVYLGSAKARPKARGIIIRVKR